MDLVVYGFHIVTTYRPPKKELFPDNFGSPNNSRLGMRPKLWLWTIAQMRRMYGIFTYIFGEKWLDEQGGNGLVNIPVPWSIWLGAHPRKLTWQSKIPTMNEDVAPTKKGDFPASHVSFQRCKCISSFTCFFLHSRPEPNYQVTSFPRLLPLCCFKCILCIYLEPKWPLFLKVNPSKQCRNSNQIKGHQRSSKGSRYIYSTCFSL